MQINFVKSEIPDEGTLAVGTTESEELTGFLEQLDKKTKGALERALSDPTFGTRIAQGRSAAVGTR